MNGVSTSRRTTNMSYVTIEWMSGDIHRIPIFPRYTFLHLANEVAELMDCNRDRVHFHQRADDGEYHAREFYEKVTQGEHYLVAITIPRDTLHFTLTQRLTPSGEIEIVLLDQDDNLYYYHDYPSEERGDRYECLLSFPILLEDESVDLHLQLSEEAWDFIRSANLRANPPEDHWCETEWCDCANERERIPSHDESIRSYLCHFIDEYRLSKQTQILFEEE